ncbi:gamma-aminobutyric acid receptor subunit beta-like, partial [Penaeus japonicus]|uniref:gamma-aminobutyric acid receptor subunit beta-like n=1 Tax=Penaeus japonicus TaxID=27405 RepID=UPI001C712A7B
MNNIRSDALEITHSSRVSSCPTKVQQYEVVKCDLEYQPSTNNFTLHLELKRLRIYHIWTTYLPSVLLLGLGDKVGSEFMSFKGSDNPLLVTEALQARSQCGYQLHDYPNDEQQCDVLIIMNNIRSDALDITHSSRVSSCPTKVQQYEVVKCDLEYQPSTNNFTLHLELKRLRIYHIWTTYLPSVLLLGLGYGTLFLPTEFFSERGTMSLTTLLVFISLYTETSSTLPSTSYLKRIDLWNILRAARLGLGAVAILFFVLYFGYP